MAQTQSFDIPLHDIKPIAEVQEYSLYYLLGASVLTLVLLGLSGYLLYKYFSAKKRFNIRKEHLGLLRSLDLGDAKKSAYALTLYGATFKDDSLRHKEMYENLTARLQPYKYKKEVSSLSSEVVGYIELYRDMIDA